MYRWGESSSVCVLNVLIMLINLLPKSIAVLLPELSLLFIGYVVEKHYVSRVTCFTNVMALNVHFLTIGESGLWLGLYADFGLLLGVWGFLHYLDRESLAEGYYVLSHLGYSSLVVGTIILYPHIEWVFSAILGDGSLPATVVAALAISVNFVLMDEASNLHYTLSRPARVNEFIENSSRIRFVSREGLVTPWKGLDNWFDVK